MSTCPCIICYVRSLHYGSVTTFRSITDPHAVLSIQTCTHTHTHMDLSPAISNKYISLSVSATHTHTQWDTHAPEQTHKHTHTSSILSPVRRVPLCAAGLSGLMCLMKTPLIIPPLLSLRPMPFPPIMLMPRDWPGARVSCTLRHTAGWREDKHTWQS